MMKPRLVLAAIIGIFLCASTLLPPTALDSRSPMQTASVPPPIASLTLPSSAMFAGIEGIRNNASSNPYGLAAPDPQIAVGPTQVVELVNQMVEIFSKQGSLVSNYTFTSFFNSSTFANLGDPRVLFDQSSGRWFASVEAHDKGIVLRVSASNDLTGNRYLYNLSTCGNLCDQPILGITDDKIILSWIYNATSSFVWILSKSEAVAGLSKIDNETSILPYLSVHPVQALSTTTTGYMVSTGQSPTNVTQLFKVTGTPPNAIINGTGLPQQITQASSQYDSYDYRVSSAVWFKGKLWYSLNDGCKPDDVNTVPCLRLTEINTNTTMIVQDFDYGVAGQRTFLPALTVDGKGNLVVVYTTSNWSVAVTGQAVNDASGTLKQPLIVKSGNGCVCISGTNFWGDYLGAAADPSNSSIVWVVGEYVPFPYTTCKAFGSNVHCWGTFIGSVSVSLQPFTMSMNPATLHMTAPSPGTIQTGYANLTITSRGFSGTITFSNNPSYSNALSGPILGYSPTSVSMTSIQTTTVSVSALICSSTPSRTFSIIGTSSVFISDVTFAVNITGQRSGSCPS